MSCSKDVPPPFYFFDSSLRFTVLFPSLSSNLFFSWPLTKTAPQLFLSSSCSHGPGAEQSKLQEFLLLPLIAIVCPCLTFPACIPFVLRGMTTIVVTDFTP